MKFQLASFHASCENCYQSETADNLSLTMQKFQTMTKTWDEDIIPGEDVTFPLDIHGFFWT